MKLLDLFCGAGGAAMGYHRAGFEVVGVDHKPQKHYPFEFHCADAFAFLEKHGQEFDVIHASPPCQRYARISMVHGTSLNHPDLLAPTRELLQQINKPWIIENVSDAPGMSSVTLCGSMFKLGSICQDGIFRQLRRHRQFEGTVPLLIPECQHDGEPIGVYGHGGPQRAARNRGYMGSVAERKPAMGIDWMTNAELSQAIPPAYTQWIGKRLLEAL